MHTLKFADPVLFLSTLSLRRATRRSRKQHHPQTLFLSTLSLRRATVDGRKRKLILIIFLSTLSLRRATPSVMQEIAQQRISIHALLAESDFSSRFLFRLLFQFLSTLSLRRATHPVCILVRVVKNFYPRSPCGERPLR